MRRSRLPFSLIQKHAQRIYMMRVEQHLAGSEEEDWQASVDYLKSRPWLVMLWQINQVLATSASYFFVDLPRSDWVTISSSSHLEYCRQHNCIPTSRKSEAV